MSSPYESRSTAAIGRGALGHSACTWPIREQDGPLMQIFSGEFYARWGLAGDCDGGGESREVQPVGHTLSNVKDDRRVSPAEEGHRRGE